MSAVYLVELKAFLNIPAGVTKDDGEMQQTLDAAESAIVKRIGPLEPTPVTRTVFADRGELLLPWPAVSITTVTPASSTTPIAGLMVSDDGMRVTGARLVGPYTVSYVAGYYVLPADLVAAVKELARHMWASQRGPAARPGSGDVSSAPGYLFPYRVQELLAPYEPVFV